MKFKRINLIKIGIFLVSGALAAFGQPDRGPILSLLAYAFGYSGIFYLLRKAETQRVLLAFSWAFFVFSITLSWIATPHYHGVAIIGVYLLLVVLFASQFALLFGFFLQKTFSWKGGIFLASAWTLIEWSRLFYFCGFPFSPIGLLMTGHIAPMQLVAYVGIYGLTFWVVFTSYLLAFQKIKCFLFCYFLPVCLGIIHLEYQETRKIAKEVCFEVALVQTGWTAEEKWDFHEKEERGLFLERAWKQIFDLLSETKKERFDLIVLPEVTLTGEAQEKIVATREGSISHLDQVKKLASLYQSEVIVGLVDGSANAAFYVQPHSDIKERYEKRVLVPLAEYLPFSFFRSFLSPYGIFSFFTPGKEAKVFYGKVPLSVSICYEEGFAHLIAEGRKKGAEILVNISNDGWFPNSRLPEEHYNLGRVRAVENGVFVLRSCNTGITAVIDPFGRVVTSMKERDEKGLCKGVTLARIDCYSYSTLFTQWGNQPIVVLSLMGMSLIFLIKRRSCSRVLHNLD